MSTYILTLKHKDPRNDDTITYSTAQEAVQHKKIAIKLGYTVTIKKEASHD